MSYIVELKNIRLTDVPSVGGKAAGLGELISELSSQGVRVPQGFAITVDAYWYYIKANNLEEPIKKLLSSLKSYDDIQQVAKVAGAIRTLLEKGTIPAEIIQEITAAYDALSQEYNSKDIDVAVRSSATAEDLPTASFAGQQETYLGIRGIADLLVSCKKVYASLFTERAIMYREDQKFDHFKVGISIAVQKMVRSDKAVSGVAFSLDTESGFRDVVIINASYGLGEAIVQGAATPDEYIVYKPTLAKGKRSIIKKKRGSKEIKMIYAAKGSGIETVPVSPADQMQFCLSDDEILEIARSVVKIEAHYTQQKKRWTPVDVEWAKDGNDNLIYIVQARSETVHANEKEGHTITRYTISDQHHAPRVIVTGQSIGQQVVSGKAKRLTSYNQIDQIKQGDILVTPMTDPNWVPVMKKVAGIITDQGGRTCHAAIVSRELNIPAIVGTEKATQLIADGQEITLDCSQGSVGFVYDTALTITKTEIQITNLPPAPIPLMLNLADPDRVFSLSFLPVAGIGLARMEFIISNTIKIHPMALLYEEKVIDKDTRAAIERLTVAYKNKTDYYIDTLAQGIGMIAAGFYPRPVIVRLSDFKSSEYRDLIGGSYFEPEEENPMLGFRGASRYYSPAFQEAFALECRALKKVREVMGFTNVKIMVPFVRTVEEGKKVIDLLAQKDLKKGDEGLEIVMMCEIPSNVILIDEFSALFDGFSIGSNDLTQLVLGVDRDSGLLTASFDERDPAVMKMMAEACDGAKRNKKAIGICGQAPSDYPEVADFLIKKGISYLSLNADSVIPFLQRYKK